MTSHLRWRIALITMGLLAIKGKIRNAPLRRVGGVEEILFEGVVNERDSDQ
jgi:hypothetical protein